jgi:hypothetical protein
MGGAERVVASMAKRWAGSPIYTSAAKWDTLLPEFRASTIRTSWMQRLPGIERHFIDSRILERHQGQSSA